MPNRRKQHDQVSGNGWAGSIEEQLAEQGGEPVVLVNILHAAPDEADALIAAWTDDAYHFKAQDGFISVQLHRGTAGSTTFMNYAVWQSVAAFRAAFTSPEFHAKLKNYPDSAAGSPHLFRKMAVDGLCIA